MSHVEYKGKRFDARTASMLREVERLTGRADLVYTQGSYSGSVGASAGTHDGGGAVDVSVSNLNGNAEIRPVVRAMRRVGFAAWYRPTIAGLWNEHIHGIAANCRDLAPAARAQVDEYRAGGDGLKGDAPDPQGYLGVPRTRTFEGYVKNRIRAWKLVTTKKGRAKVAYFQSLAYYK